MKVIKGKKNIMMYDCDAICVTTNGIVSWRTDLAIMGKGIAAQIAKLDEEIPKLLGLLIQKNGNVVQFIKELEDGRDLYAFPTKHHWKDNSSIALIRRSSQCLRYIASERSRSIFALPRPGCSNGGLEWNVVKPIINKILPLNIHIVDLNG